MEIREIGLIVDTHFRFNGKNNQVRVGFKSSDYFIDISEKNVSASNQFPYSSLCEQAQCPLQQMFSAI